jgi:hypothetical protein
MFNWRGDVHWSTLIVKAILEADSPRISDVARAMGGRTEAGMRSIHRFLRWGEDSREAMKLLYHEEAEYLIADPTEISRAQARKTEYVSLLFRWGDAQAMTGCFSLSLPLPGPGHPVSLRQLLLLHDCRGGHPSQPGAASRLGGSGRVARRYPAAVRPRLLQ